MPVFKLDIEKFYENEYWTNVYYLEAADLPSGIAPADRLVLMERANHKQVVQFTKYRISDEDPNTDAFITVPLIANGNQQVNGDLWPLFNVCLVSLAVQGFGRPSRKYYRFPWDESEIGNDGAINVTRISEILGNIDAAITDLAGAWVDESGNSIVSSSMKTVVAMRQLRRGSRRRSQPVI